MSPQINTNALLLFPQWNTSMLMWGISFIMPRGHWQSGADDLIDENENDLNCTQSQCKYTIFDHRSPLASSKHKTRDCLLLLLGSLLWRHAWFAPILPLTGIISGFKSSSRPVNIKALTEKKQFNIHSNNFSTLTPDRHDRSCTFIPIAIPFFVLTCPLGEALTACSA